MNSYDLCECNKPLQLNYRDTPVPQGSEVLLRVLAAGVCHSDLNFARGYFDLGGGKRLNILERGFKLPITMGHENVGEVVAVGPDSKGVEVGGRHLINSWVGCGECPVCVRDEEHLCMKPRFLGAYRNGGFATHIIVPDARYLLDIGDLAPEVAAPLACAGITTFSALKKINPSVLRDQPIVIIGAGGLGFMALELLKAMGGRGAVVVDIDPVKREAAKAAGALAVVDGTAADAVAQVQSAVVGGVWAVVDLVGASSTVQLAMDVVAKGGQVVIVGMYGGEVTVPTAFFPMRAMTVQGSYLGSAAEMAELLELVRRHGAPAIPITTKQLDQVNEALEDLHSGRVVGRVVLTAAA